MTSSSEEFYARWCFYCQTLHDAPETLREHVGHEHPGSAREERYRAAERVLDVVQA